MADKKFLDEDGVSQFAEETKKYVDNHADNTDIHVTTDDKANWNAKQSALTAEQLAAVNSGINATAKGNYDAHVANADIHVTAADKANWNGKQDALTSQQIANINDVVNKANASDLTAHTSNADIHVTTDDKNVWNGKQNALTAQQLSNIADVVNKANASDLTAHTNNTDIHVTSADKNNWNSKQNALTSQQLANIADVVNKANDSDVVHKSGDETIGGTKTFSSAVYSSGSGGLNFRHLDGSNNGGMDGNLYLNYFNSTKNVYFNGGSYYINGGYYNGRSENAQYAYWLRASSHADHLFHTEWDGSYFWTYVTAGDGGYRAVRVERSNSSGYADSAGNGVESSGTNYIRYKDGTQICWGEDVDSNTITFPMPFINDKYSCHVNHTGTSTNIAYGFAQRTTTKAFVTASAASNYNYFCYVAIGKWK